MNEKQRKFLQLHRLMHDKLVNETPVEMRGLVTFSHDLNSWLAQAGDGWQRVSARTAYLLCVCGFTLLDAD